MTIKYPLSNLQREILRIANEQQYVGYPDILMRFYGFVPSHHGKLMFTRHREMQREIRSARVAICKCFNRLVLRGIVRRVHAENHVNHCITLIAECG